MRSLSLFLAAAAILPHHGALAARYDVTLYPEKGCKGEAYACPNIKKKACCQNGGTKYYAAMVRETGTDTCTDELRAYKALDKDYCGLSLGQTDDAKCLSSSAKELTGATVYESGFFKRDEDGHGDDDDDEDDGVATLEPVWPSEYRYENGSTRYVIRLDSPDGRAVEAMGRYEDRVEFAVRVGAAEAILPVNKRAACGGAGGGTAKGKGKKGTKPL